MGLSQPSLLELQQHLSTLFSKTKGEDSAGPMPARESAAGDTAPWGSSASAAVSSALERLIFVLELYSRRDSSAASDDFAVVWQRRADGRKWRYHLHWWCLNPAVGFRSMSSLCRSIILTSGVFIINSLCCFYFMSLTGTVAQGHCLLLIPSPQSWALRFL